MNLGVRDRVALVTGGSQGIGRAIAIALAREGARVGVTYRTNQEKADAVAAGIRDEGSDAVALPLELSSDDSISAAVDALVKRWGRVDILVLNAVQWASHRVGRAPAFEDLARDEWRALLRSNIEGSYAITQAVLPYMRQRGWGRMVTISSIVAHDGMRGVAWYATVKSAMHGLTRSLASEVGSDGILVNVVMAGPTLSDRTRSVVPPAALDGYARLSPIRRLLTPDDLAATVAFLCSAANTSITGEVIRVSGGLR